MMPHYFCRGDLSGRPKTGRFSESPLRYSCHIFKPNWYYMQLLYHFQFHLRRFPVAATFRLRRHKACGYRLQLQAHFKVQLVLIEPRGFHPPKKLRGFNPAPLPCSTWEGERDFHRAVFKAAIVLKTRCVCYAFLDFCFLRTPNPTSSSPEPSSSREEGSGTTVTGPSNIRKLVDPSRPGNIGEG